MAVGPDPPVHVTTQPAPANPLARVGGPNIPGQLPGAPVDTNPFTNGNFFHVIPSVTGVGTGTVPQSNLAGSSPKVAPQQFTTAAIGTAIALPFGRVRIGAKITQPVIHPSGDLLLPCIIGQGVIESLEAIQFDNAAAPAGVTSTFYQGTQTQNADPWLVAAWLLHGKTYTDKLRGIAYVVVRIPKAASFSFSGIAFIVKGLRVYDPRDGTQTQGDASTYKYSTNPALHLAYFLSEPGIGTEEVVDWTSVGTMAAINDQLCGTGAQQEKRRESGLYLDQQQDIDAVEDLLRAHAGCWVVREGDAVRLVPDAPATSVYTFTTAKYRLDSLQITKKGRSNAPTVIFVRWTNTAVLPWADTEGAPLPAMAAGVTSGSTPWIESQVPLAGIQQPGQAWREQVRRLNDAQLCDLSITFIALDEGGASVMTGDVFLLSDNEGFSLKAWRCTSSFPVEPGRWQVTADEYQDAAYSDDPASGPITPDTNLPDPRVINAPTGLVITETVYLEKNIPADSLARGFIYQSRFDCSFTASDYPYPAVYRFEVWLGGQKIADAMTSNNLAFSTGPLQQGQLYTIKVFTRSAALGIESAALSDTATCQGRNLPPGDVPSFTQAQSIGGDIHLAVNPAADVDTVRYEWRYTPNVTVGGSWESATVIDRIDGLRAYFRGLPVGTHRFYVKAISAGGLYSANAIFTDLAVSTDANAFLQAHEFTSPTLTNMISIPPIEGVNKKRWATSMAGDAWNTIMPNPVNSGGDPVQSYHASGTSQFIGDPWDLGEEVTGDWTMTPNETDVTGTADLAIATSDDLITIVNQPGVSWKGSARYTAPVITATTTETMEIEAPPKIALAAVTKKESSGGVTVTSNAGTPKTITLANKYVKAVRITITPVATTARIPTVSNIVLSLSGANSFDVYLFDAAGVQVADSFNWDFEGF